MAKVVSVFVVVGLFALAYFLPTGKPVVTITEVPQQWTAGELSAYLAYIEDGHEGYKDTDFVSLERSKVPNEVIQRAIEYKRNLDNLKLENIRLIKEHMKNSYE